jgi:quinol monooxygenase YgiN
MLIVAGEFRVPPEHREAFATAARELTGPTREEPGCRVFEFWSDLDEAGRFLVFEIWGDPDDLVAHRTTPHVAAFLAAVSGLDATSDLKRYLASETDV